MPTLYFAGHVRNPLRFQKGDKLIAPDIGYEKATREREERQRKAEEARIAQQQAEAAAA